MGQFVTLYLLDKVHVTGTGIQMMLLVAPGLAQRGDTVGLGSGGRSTR